MAGDNMESLLLGGDDSSSGESDTEVVAVAPPAVAAAPVAASGAKTTMSQSEISQRLKSMYSPANKGGGGGAKPPVAAVPTQASPRLQAQQQQIAPAPVAPSRPSSIPHQIAPPQLQQRSSAISSSAGGSSSSQPRSGGIPHQQVPRGGIPHQQVPQQQQQPPVVAQSRGIPHQQISQQQQQQSRGIPHQQTLQQQQQQSRGIPHQQTLQQQQSRGIPHQQTLQQQQQQSRGIPHQQTLQQQQQQSRGIPHQQTLQQQQAHGNTMHQMSQQQQKPRGIPHQQVQPRRNSQGGGVDSSSRPTTASSRSDPYEPTPVAKMIQKSQQQQMPPPSRGIPHQTTSTSRGITHQTSTANSSARTSFNSTGGTNAPTAATSRSNSGTTAAMDEREIKKRKEKFLIFTRVLMKYLEQKDPPLHAKVKVIIKDCADRNKRGEVGYESVTESMRSHLKRVVSENYWKRAEAYLDHFLKEKAKNGSSSAQQLTGISSNSNSSKSQQDALLRQQQLLLQQKRKLEQQQQQQQQNQKQQQQPQQPSIKSVREDIRKKQKSLANNQSKSDATQTFQAPTTKGKGSSKGGSTPKTSDVVSPPQQPQQRRTSLTAATPDTAAVVATQPIVREYAELMEMVDHAIDYDWTAAGSILGEKTQWTLSDEQKKLIYDDSISVHLLPPPPSEISAFPVEGWSRRNIVSSRVAWARIRLGKKQPDTAQPASVVINSIPTVGGGLLSLSPVPSDAAEQSTETVIDAEWCNEETAELDKALAVLSEGAEIYLRSVVEKALHCARQRQNLDGIRLWHEQHARAEAAVKPALALRLGCDVTRQIAQSEGNACMIFKRQEEALMRQSNVPERDRVINDETLAKASSMSDLALRPRLGKAVADADLEGKRKFEVYGGKESGEPPFGRVPKQAKLEVVDFQTGMSFTRRPGRRHQAATMSSSFFF